MLQDTEPIYLYCHKTTNIMIFKLQLVTYFWAFLLGSHKIPNLENLSNQFFKFHSFLIFSLFRCIVKFQVLAK